MPLHAVLGQADALPTELSLYSSWLPPMGPTVIGPCRVYEITLLGVRVQIKHFTMDTQTNNTDSINQ